MSTAWRCLFDASNIGQEDSMCLEIATKSCLAPAWEECLFHSCLGQDDSKRRGLRLRRGVER